MVQLELIRSKLIDKETELSLLAADINMLKVDRDDKTMEVQSKFLKILIFSKISILLWLLFQILGLTVQLDILKAENEVALKRIHEFEIQLEKLRCNNSQLSEEVLKKSGNLFYICFRSMI